MKLEQAIQQTDFQSKGHRLGLNLIYTFNWLREQQKNFFSGYGITTQQYNVLRILRGHYPQSYSTSDIRDRMLDRMSDASRIVDRLVKKELVIRTTNSLDKRLVDIKISNNGLKLVNAMDESVEKHVLKLFKNLDTEEQEILDRLLDKIRG